MSLSGKLNIALLGIIGTTLFSLGGTGLRVPTNDDSLWTSGSNGSIYYNSGNVGINVAAPITALDIDGNGIRQKNYTEIVTDRLYCTTSAKRYEIARATVDVVSWNQLGPIEVDLLEMYWGRGFEKKYYVYWGFPNTSGIYLAEADGDGLNNNFQASIGTPVQVSDDNYYIPIYVDLKYYAWVQAIVRTNRSLTNSNPPGRSQIYINPSPTGIDISDFTADSTVFLHCCPN